MRQAVETNLEPINAPLEWAVTMEGHFYAALIAARPDGSMDTGNIVSQTKQTMDNLKHCVEAAGGDMDDIAQVTIYLTDRSDAAKMNETYAPYFSAPYPNRATVVISELMVPGCIIEIVAFGHIKKK
ncbi:MAG: reactive intermediate/imine deaminase [Rhodospirillaceae bacterium]|nr:reactive intermediate/imine deaminase [Rhodospirillaceae bacterium]MAL77492.1 reactive intermediate/imine deaminase [Rhodospirillaceae bacterium]MAX62287.1 reactive intermediate/imine deaminase [Rhodospirillaceae bacterium]|tara:strand:- start:128 stop:508 length:381 start_codon:yes stop_codon:yes gene_type:complete